MNQHNNKYSLIGEVAYTKDWGRMQLALGYRATLAKSDYRISNILSDYKEYSTTPPTTSTMPTHK